MNIWTNRNTSADHLSYLYRHGFLLYEGHVAYCEGFNTSDSGNTRATLTVVTPNGDASTKRGLTSEKVIETFIPILGVYNDKIGVSFSQWHARRQYVRVLSVQTLMSETLLKRERKALGMSITIPKSLTWGSLYNPTYPSISDALRQVDSGEYLARAFNNKFYFANSFDSNSIALGYKRHMVGEVNVEKNTIKLSKEHGFLRESLIEHCPNMEVQ